MITWTQARNFSYGIRLLPPVKRQALAAVYAFARRIDDIGDGDLPKPAKLAALADARASVTALGAQPGPPGDEGGQAAPGLLQRGQLLLGRQRAVSDVVDPPGEGVDGGQGMPLRRRQ